MNESMYIEDYQVEGFPTSFASFVEVPVEHPCELVETINKSRPT